MSDQYVWQPVEGVSRIVCDCGECDRTIETDDGYIEIYDGDGLEMTAHLPDEYALCRRVPVPAQGMPVEDIRELMGIALAAASFIPDVSSEYIDIVSRVQVWLDAQGQEASE